MVDSFTSRSGPIFLHHDGEFVSGIDLVKATMTARNFGWLPIEYQQAVATSRESCAKITALTQLAADRTNGVSLRCMVLTADAETALKLLGLADLSQDGGRRSRCTRARGVFLTRFQSLLVEEDCDLLK